MSLLVDLSTFLFFLFILIFSGSILVRTLSVIGKFLGLSDFVTGFIIMAIATSLPETFVAISSAFNNTPELSLGDALGSSFVEMTLILGLCLVLTRKIRITHKNVRHNSVYMMAIGTLPLILLADRTLSRLDGFFLLAVFVLYFWLVLRKQRFIQDHEQMSKKTVAKNMGLFVLGVMALLISSHYVVKSGVSIAIDMGIPLLTVGLIGIGVGTALPELVFGIKSVLKGKKEMSLGDTFGSVIVNSTLVLGVLAVIQPFSILNFTLFSITAMFFIGAVTIDTIFILVRRDMTWVHGILLLMLYVLFVAVQVRIA